VSSDAPVDDPVVEPDYQDEAPPKISVTRRQAIVFGLFVVSAVAFLYFVLPQLGGLEDTWHRVETGSPSWLVAALLFRIGSYVGYMWLFQTVCVRADSVIDWRANYLITMAGVAATRLFAAAGAGGIALTAWALRRSGMDRREVAERLVAFNVLLYTVYALALLIGGFGLYVGLFSGPAPFAITMIPAIVMAALFVLVYTTALLPGDVERRLARWASGQGRVHRIVARLAAAPASVAEGVRLGVEVVRRREWGLLGGILWWAFDIATLWAAFHAFSGETPPIAVIVVAYFVGMFGNMLPLPGGIGGVDGGMIGAFAAFGVDFGLAAVAVLTYRAFWLPTLPGAVAYIQLRRTVAGWRREVAVST
jgi:uncharacterized protein (TIRG00374 family)